MKKNTFLRLGFKCYGVLLMCLCLLISNIPMVALAQSTTQVLIDDSNFYLAIKLDGSNINIHDNVITMGLGDKMEVVFRNNTNYGFTIECGSEESNRFFRTTQEIQNYDGNDYVAFSNIPDFRDTNPLLEVKSEYESTSWEYTAKKYGECSFLIEVYLYSNKLNSKPIHSFVQEFTLNITSFQQAELSTIRRIENIYVERDGYVCVEDNEGIFYYLDENGNIKHTVDHPRDMMSGKTIYLAAGKNTYYLYKDGVYYLYDFQGKQLRSFKKASSSEGYSFISAVNEGLIATQEASHSKEDATTAVVYFDETGKETMRFDGYVYAGRASCFSGGRAFICQLYKNDGSKNYQYRGNNPTNWKIIDQNGTLVPLRVADLSVLNGALAQQMNKLAIPDGYEGYVETIGFEFTDVHPFYEDEEYASCMIEVHTNVNRRRIDSWSKDYNKYEKRFYVPSRIDKEGKVYWGNCALEYNVVLSDYINDCVIMENDSAPFDTYGFINFKKGIAVIGDDHPIAVAERAKGDDHGYWNSINFMDDGNLMFISYSNSAYTAAILRPDGSVAEGPNELDEFPEYAKNYNVLSEYSLREEKALVYFDWQTTSLNQINMVVSRDGLYPKVSSDNYLWGFADIWGNMVIEPKYYEVSFFKNGYAYACTEEDNAPYVTKKFAKNLIMIDETGKQVDKVVFQQPKTVKTKPLEVFYSAEETARAAEIVLTTDNQFRIATNIAVLPVGLGETCGYLYDVATFDLPGLIKHVYSDATHQYRVDAARVIAQTLLGEYDELELTAVSLLIQEYVKSDEYKEAKDYKMESSDLQKDLMKLLSKHEKGDDVAWFAKFGEENLKAFGRFLNCINLFGKYIDEIEVTLDDRLVLYMLASNYEKNMAYIQTCIATCDPANEEMIEIYKIVQKDLHTMYEAYIQNASTYIATEGFLDVIFSEVTYDALSSALASAKLTLSEGLKFADQELLKAQGFSEADAKKTTNFYMLAHSLVVKYAEKVGTKATYQSMQKLYENAIVVNAMVQELSPLVQKATQYKIINEEKVINKSIALGEYRLTVLDNLTAYHNACSSGEYFLDLSAIATERLQLQLSLDYLKERKKMLN